ncbi:MAG TPA: BrnA antitoxin family protein [Thermomicrobiales bacterium]|nr:BrnA antitoxin family protein [Thermomicrobiales bacterium]
MSAKSGTSASYKDIDAKLAEMEDPRYWEQADRISSRPEWEASLTEEDGAGLDWTNAVFKPGDPRLESSEKQQLTVRYDKKVIDYFKGTGKGYQTRMNAVLRDYVERQLKRDAS